jgi:hypothetical protein
MEREAAPEPDAPARSRDRPSFRLPWLWPRSLAGRTAVTLLAGLMVIQGAGLAIHAFDRIDVQRLAQARAVSARFMSVYRSVVLTPAPEREALINKLDVRAALSAEPPTPPDDLIPMPPGLERLLRVDSYLVPLEQKLRPHEWRMFGDFAHHRVNVSMRLPDGTWLTVGAALQKPRFWHSPRFLAAFLLMTVAAALLTLWAVRRLTAPVATLAAAAEALGRDVNAPPLPETGPTEVAVAAIAFNTMAARIRRFVRDRTEMLTAIGHDLRTPITRLKLRAEFMEDDEQRRKMLADLDEMEAMVAATLAFGRDAARDEPLVPLDLGAMLRTVLDEAADAVPERADDVAYEGPAQLTVRARPLGLKRAFVNLIGNALLYGESACVRVHTPVDGMVRVEIEDDGPGLPPDEIERVFEPFHRVEGSRNRETGGTGLGLPIARDILRAHGGNVTLANRLGGGARATVTLPV